MSVNAAGVARAFPFDANRCATQRRNDDSQDVK
jgi:hypothetical protein